MVNFDFFCGNFIYIFLKKNYTKNLQFRYNKHIIHWWVGRYRYIYGPQAMSPWPQAGIYTDMALPNSVYSVNIDPKEYCSISCGYMITLVVLTAVFTSRILWDLPFSYSLQMHSEALRINICIHINIKIIIIFSFISMFRQYWSLPWNWGQ